MKKRIISALLLMPVILSAAACGTDTEKTGGDTTADTEILQNDYPAGIKKQNYDGTVNILMPDWGLFINYFDPGDDMTDIMNKALYNREIKVEDYLGVEITYEHVPTIQDVEPALAVTASTNDDLYQIVLNHCIWRNTSNITNGYLLDMNELDIDFTGEWFNRSGNDALSLYGKQYLCVSDYNLPDPNMILFNKDMAENLGIEDPYQLVRDGKWTIDKMAELASRATQDNGDTVWNVNDTYGFSCPDNWYTASFLFGADIPIIEKNEDGYLYMAFGDERTYTFMEKMDALINSKDTYTFDSRAYDGEAAFVDKGLPIESGRCLFTLYTFNKLYTIRDVEIGFGILPYPKLDEEQEQYISNDWAGLTCVPISLYEDSYTMVGDVIELLAYYSAEEVIPTYIDVTLGIKLSRDEESKEMINLIFNTCTFKPGMNYFGLNDMFFSVHKMLIATGQNNLASFIASNGPALETKINEFNEAVEYLD